MPIIIMTAYSDLDSAVAAFQGGAFEYLPKPFDIDHALALIRRAAIETAHGRGPQWCPMARTRPRSWARRRRCRMCFARSAGLAQSTADRPDHGRIGHRQGAGRAGPFRFSNKLVIGVPATLSSLTRLRSPTRGSGMRIAANVAFARLFELQQRLRGGAHDRRPISYA